MSEVKTVPELSSSEFRVRTVRAQHPFILDDPSLVWLVRSGTTEIFNSQVEGGSLVGRRRFLFRARPHDALFAMMDATNTLHSRLIMMAVEELTVQEIPLKRMKEVFQSEGVSVIEAIEGWVNNVVAFASNGAIPAGAEHISCGGELALDPGQDLHPGRNEFAWVRVNEGRAVWMGIPELEVDLGEAYLPLGSGMWLRAAERLKLKALRTQEMVADQDLLSGLWL